jgi:predicted phosphodiesterase
VEDSILIEHGNRYDGWNVISHDALREIRSAISRREKPALYNGPPGSQVVFKIMNRLKAKYPFVDLLKPETAAVFPLLAVLDPSTAREIPRFASLAAKEARVRFDSNGIPLDIANIAAPVQRSKRDSDMMLLANELAGSGDMANIGNVDKVKDFLSRLREAATDIARKALREQGIQLLYKAFRAYADVHRQTFDLGHEAEEYLKPAKAAAERGFQVVVFGHTHNVKRIALNERGAQYLNAGTWADLIQVPEAILSGNEDEAKAQLSTFVHDMEHNRLENWRVQVPTFAQITLDSGILESSDVMVFDTTTGARPIAGDVIKWFQRTDVVPAD